MRRLAVSLVLAGALVWLAAPALSQRPFVPRVAEFSHAPRLDAVQRGGEWRSRVLTAPKRFDLIGLRWRSGGELRARIRVRTSAGWSPWTEMAGDHAGGDGAEPVWAGGADAYQLRFDRLPRGLRAQFVNATGSATAAARVQTALRRGLHRALAAVAGARALAQDEPPLDAPAIVPRELWGADQCPPRTAPSYGEVQVGFVHHTVNANAYSAADSAAMVLAICRYHRNSNRWRDIGYNFVVDRYGQIFEGRAGGIDQPVIGAQAQGYNGLSTGVANLGTFAGVPQTAAGIRATAELLAWKMTLHGAPVDGTATVGSGGGPANRYPVGTPVTFARIAGHRDADRTSCPGDALFAQLPEIRARAAAIAPDLPAAAAAARLTLLAADRTLDYPQPAALAGRMLDAAGTPLAAVPVSLQIATAAGFSTVARTTTGADGGWSASLRTQYTRTLRAVARLPDGSRATSRTLAVEVAPRIRLRVAKRVTARRRFTVRGSVRPLRARVALEVAREGTDGRMHTVARLPVAVTNGSFAARVTLRRPALHRLRISSRSDARNAGGRSGDAYLRAVRPR